MNADGIAAVLAGIQLVYQVATDAVNAHHNRKQEHEQQVAAMQAASGNTLEEALNRTRMALSRGNINDVSSQLQKIAQRRSFCLLFRRVGFTEGKVKTLGSAKLNCIDADTGFTTFINNICAEVARFDQEEDPDEVSGYAEFSGVVVLELTCTSYGTNDRDCLTFAGMIYQLLVLKLPQGLPTGVGRLTYEYINTETEDVPKRNVFVLRGSMYYDPDAPQDFALADYSVDMNLFLLGRTRSGKSTLGNALLKAFGCHHRQFKMVKGGTGTFAPNVRSFKHPTVGHMCRIIDTPGLFDESRADAVYFGPFRNVVAELKTCVPPVIVVKYKENGTLEGEVLELMTAYENLFDPELLMDAKVVVTYEEADKASASHARRNLIQGEAFTQRLGRRSIDDVLLLNMTKVQKKSPEISDEVTRQLKDNMFKGEIKPAKVQGEETDLDHSRTMQNLLSEGQFLHMAVSKAKEVNIKMRTEAELKVNRIHGKSGANLQIKWNGRFTTVEYMSFEKGGILRNVGGAFVGLRSDAEIMQLTLWAELKPQVIWDKDEAYAAVMDILKACSMTEGFCGGIRGRRIISKTFPRIHWVLYHYDHVNLGIDEGKAFFDDRVKYLTSEGGKEGDHGKHVQSDANKLLEASLQVNEAFKKTGNVARKTMNAVNNTLASLQ